MRQRISAAVADIADNRAVIEQAKGMLELLYGVDEATAFARTRIIGGRPLGEYQLVAGMLADSATELFAARTMLYEVARSIDAGADQHLADTHGCATTCAGAPSLCAPCPALVRAARRLRAPRHGMEIA